MTPSDIQQREQSRPATAGKPAVQARQGVISGRVVTVLVVSLFLGIVALAICWSAFR
jgi:hypothetical protein